MPHPLRRLAAVALAAVLLPGPAPAADADGFRAGAFAIDVTPTKFPISVNGGMTDRQAKGAHDRLHARCLVLDDGKTAIAFAVVDSCMVPRPVADDARRQAARAAGIPADHILISATHTHTAPTLAGTFQSEPDPDYPHYLAGRIAEGIARAAHNRAPAQAGWAVAKEPNQVFNRRWKMKPGTLNPDPFGRGTDRVEMNPGYRNPGLVEPAGPTDPDVSVLSVRARDGRPIALLANYSLHYVGGVPELSADYYGMFAERIATLLGADKVDPPFVGILSNGTSGDVNNINFKEADPGTKVPGEQARLVADAVARAALDACKTIRYRDDVTLAMAEQELELGVRKPDAQEIERARGILAEAKAKGKDVLTTLPEVYARETVLMAKYPDRVKAKVQAIRVGGLGIAAIPCEVFAETGLDIKKRSPLKPTFTIELANGYNGYLPTPAQHRLGGYETWRARSSYLEVDASTKLTDAVLGLLKAVAQ
jgi:hypothetical protein